MEKTLRRRVRRFVNVKPYIRRVRGKPQRVRGYRRRLPKNYVSAMKELARSQTEYGGEIDFHPDGSHKMTIFKGKDDRITLHPTGAEVVYHTHPIVDKDGNIIESEARLQRTPSPDDVIIMLMETWDENWVIPTARDFIVYKETTKTPKYSKQLEREMRSDYHRLEADSYTKYLNIKDPVKRDIKQTEWFSKNWENILKKKYHIYVRRFGEDEDVVISGKHLR